MELKIGNGDSYWNVERHSWDTFANQKLREVFCKESSTFLLMLLLLSIYMVKFVVELYLSFMNMYSGQSYEYSGCTSIEKGLR